ncbi:Ankyrin-2 [Pestalotiopsis sp. 9143b]|nr:Ankyrin-2 [Pestalotiopsis sp. 9143b]
MSIVSSESSPRMVFCTNETDTMEDRPTLMAHFTFDRHDDRRNSALAMATSLIAQIIKFSKNETTFVEKLSSQRWLFRTWTTFDALHILEQLTYNIEIVFVLQDFDQCDSTSRQQCLDMFKRIILLRDGKIRLLVASDKNILAEWVGESLNPHQKSPTSPHQTLDRVMNLHVGEVLHVGTPSSSSFREDDTKENHETSDLERYLELRFIDAGFPEVSAQDLIHRVLTAGDTDLRDVLLLQLNSPAPIPPFETLFSLANSQSLYTMFCKVLEGVQESERQLIRHILSWVTYSVRPLNKNEVRLVHPVARELLSRPGTEWFNIDQDAHLHIVLSCLDILSREEFVARMEENKGSECNLDGHNVLVSRSTFENRTTLHCYIITKWPEHYRQIPASYRPKNEVVSFFEKDGGRVWKIWARARWIMSNPINRGERQETFRKGLMPFVAEIGDLELLKCWEKVSGNQNPEDIGNALEEASRVGAGDIVNRLLKDGDFEASQLQAAMSAAASSAESEVLMILISAAPKEFAWPASLLVRVSELGYEDCVRALLTRGCNPNTPVGDLKTTALLRATSIGNAQICDLLLQHDANPNYSDLKGITVVTMAPNCARGADVIETLVAYKIDVMAKDKSGRSALAESCRLGHFEVCQALVNVAKDSEKSPSFEDIEKWLQWTAERNFCQTAVPLLDLLRAGPNAHILKRQLRNAVKLGRLQFVRLLFERCRDLLSPLEAADDELPWLSEVCNSADADLDLMKLFVDADAEVDPDTKSISPLKSAARKGRLDLVKFLIEHGAQVNKNESTKSPALTDATHSGNLECVRYLLKSGANIEGKDQYGETAIFKATEGRHDVANFLLDQGAAVSGQGFKGRTLPMLYISSASTLRRILERGSEIDTKHDNGWASIHFAAANGDSDAISVLSEFKAELNIETSAYPNNEATPLMLATFHGHCESVRVLLEAGASVDYAVFGSRRTALHWAKIPEVIGILLEYGPDVNAPSSHGSTALHLKIKDEPPDFVIIKQLVNARANVNAVCKAGCCLPLLNLARSVDHWPIIEYLISKNADINMATFRFGSALHRACYQSDLPLVKLLHAAGAKADVGVGGYPGSPLQSACRSLEDDEKVLAVMRYLIEDAQADVNQLCGVLGTALSVACQRESSKALKFLLDHGASCSIPDQAGRLPVHLAALATSANFDHLVTLGCDVHAVDNTGRTVLQWAAQGGDVEIVETILSFLDVQVDRPDKDGWTALCWAARGIASEAGRSPSRNPEAQGDIINLLLKHGANKSLQVPGDAGQTWNPLQIAIFHNSGEKVKNLLTEKQEAPGTDKRKQHPSLRRGHRQGTTGHAYCDCCLSIHDPTHEFESFGPIFDESDSAEDKDSDNSDDTESEASIALGSD